MKWADIITTLFLHLKKLFREIEQVVQSDRYQ